MSLRTATLTVTATTGPGQVLTSQVFSNVNKYMFGVTRGILYLYYDDELHPKEFDLGAVTAVTVTIASDKSQTVVVS